MAGDCMVMGLSENKHPKIIVDTSALLSLCDGFDFFTSVENEFGKVKYVIPTSVMDELKRLAETSPKYDRCLKLLSKIMTINNVSIIYTGSKKIIADDDLLEMSGDLFVTNDMELAQKLSKQNKKVFILKKNRYYDFYH